ncbi:MAG: hypothetical protein R3A52_23455 [Polyangiales bacterium]
MDYARVVRRCLVLAAAALAGGCAIDFDRYHSAVSVDVPITSPDVPITSPDVPITSPDVPPTSADVPTTSADGPAPPRDAGGPPLPALAEAAFTLCSEPPRDHVGVRVLNGTRSRLHLCVETPGGLAPFPFMSNGDPTIGSRLQSVRRVEVGDGPWVRFVVRTSVPSSTRCDDPSGSPQTTSAFPVVAGGDYTLVIGDGASGLEVRFLRDGACSLPTGDSDVLMRVVNATTQPIEVSTSRSTSAPGTVRWRAVTPAEYGGGGDAERGYRRMPESEEVMIVRISGQPGELVTQGSLMLQYDGSYQAAFVRDTVTSTGYTLVRCGNVRMSTDYVTCHAVGTFSR